MKLYFVRSILTLIFCDYWTIFLTLNNFFLGLNCLYPCDFVPFTRRPLFLVIDSDNSEAFKASLISLVFGLMSITCIFQLQSDNYLLWRFYIVDIKSRDGSLICPIGPVMSSMGFSHPIKGIGSGWASSKTHLMFGVGMGSSCPDLYQVYLQKCPCHIPNSLTLRSLPLSSLPSIVLAMKPPSSQHSDLNCLYILLFHVWYLFEIIPFLSSHCFMFEINLFIDGICVVSMEGWVCLVLEWRDLMDGFIGFVIFSWVFCHWWYFWWI